MAALSAERYLSSNGLLQEYHTAVQVGPLPPLPHPSLHAPRPFLCVRACLPECVFVPSAFVSCTLGKFSDLMVAAR